VGVVLPELSNGCIRHKQSEKSPGLPLGHRASWHTSDPVVCRVTFCNWLWVKAFNPASFDHCLALFSGTIYDNQTWKSGNLSIYDHGWMMFPFKALIKKGISRPCLMQLGFPGLAQCLSSPCLLGHPEAPHEKGRDFAVKNGDPSTKMLRRYWEKQWVFRSTKMSNTVMVPWELRIRSIKIPSRNRTCYFKNQASLFRDRCSHQEWGFSIDPETWCRTID
jgi:hypothetical protein